MSKLLQLKPRISEKAYYLSQLHNTYIFEVPHSTNKHDVQRAVVAQYNVTVVEVNTTTVKGKNKRTVRRGGKVSEGKRNDIKKAYVTLKSGDNLPFFADELASSSKPDKQKGAK